MPPPFGRPLKRSVVWSTQNVYKAPRSRIYMARFTTIQSYLVTDQFGAPNAATSITIADSAEHVVLATAGCAVYMSMTEQGLDIMQQRFLITDLNNAGGPFTIPAPKGANSQLWFAPADGFAATPLATLSVMVN